MANKRPLLRKQSTLVTDAVSATRQNRERDLILELCSILTFTYCSLSSVKNDHTNLKKVENLLVSLESGSHG